LNLAAVQRYQAKNRDAVRERARRYQKKNREALNAAERMRAKRIDVRARRRDQHLQRRYGISLAQYNALFAAQNGSCAICGISALETQRVLDVDHEHKTGTVRGLLCNACNTGLGKFRDAPEYLAAALRYLTREKLN
jgi:hypothetical protein